MSGGISISAGLGLDRLARGGVSNPLLNLEARGLALGDSYSDLVFSTGLRNHFSWARFLLNGRVRIAIGGAEMAIAGSRLTESTGTNGAYPQNDMLYRVENQIRYIAPDFTVFLGGINTFANNGFDEAATITQWDQVFDAMRSLLPNMVIFACTIPYSTAILGSPTNIARLDNINAHIRSKAASDSKAVLVDYNPIYTPATDSIGDAVSHPNVRGGYILGTALATAINSVLAAGSVLPISTTPAAGQLDTHFYIPGTSGTLAGSANGSVTTGKTLTGVAGATVVGSKEAAAVGEKQVITITGTPSAAGATTLSETLAITGSVAGDMFELVSEFSVEAAGGGAPAGLLQFGDNFVGSDGFLYTSTDVNAVALPCAVSGVIRTTPLHINSTTTSQVATAIGLRSSATVNDIVAKVGLQIARKVETVAYALPFNTSLSVKTSTNFRAQIAGTLTNGSLQTCRPGGHSGGAVVLSYQWDKNGTPIGGATSQTYTASGMTTGDVLGCTIRGTNLFGFTENRVVAAAFP